MPWMRKEREVKAGQTRRQIPDEIDRSIRALAEHLGSYAEVLRQCTTKPGNR